MTQNAGSLRGVGDQGPPQSNSEKDVVGSPTSSS
jgi:hypothetical protein